MITELNFKTSKKQELIDITHEIEMILRKVSIDEGICYVYTPHATCSLIINENADPNMKEDILKAINKLVPMKNNYLHDKIDDNAHSHIKSAILGCSVSVPVKHGHLMLGRWQSILLCDFDGPRTRKVIITIK